MTHTPVLQKEILEYLNPKSNENFIDCTVGEGGHARIILKNNGPAGKVLGIDQDPKQIANCETRMVSFKERLVLVNDSYINLKEIVKKNNFNPVHGILLDLGISSWQLEKSGRGFSFLEDEPLDMRYNTEIPNPKSQIPNYLTAEEIVNKYRQEEIEKILKEYGEEKFAQKITKEIVRTRKTRPIKTTIQLVEIIEKAIPYKYQHGRIHPATKTFQALRIAVNDELNNLEKVLPQIINVLEEGGRMAIISFHSLEDRIIKNFFREKAKVPKSPRATGMAAEGLSKGTLKILTKKPIMPSFEEIKLNSRSRSAKLRAAIKN